MSFRHAVFDNALGILIKKPYICPSCLTNRKLSAQRALHSNLSPRSRPRARRLRHEIRTQLPRSAPSTAKAVSTTASVTAINAKKEIPYNAENLYRSLSALEHEAGSHVNLSQLRLALRGLESQDAVTRVASMSGLGEY